MYNINMKDIITTENSLTINNRNILMSLEGKYGGMSADFANNVIKEEITTHPYIQNVFLNMNDVNYVSKRTVGFLSYLEKTLESRNKKLFLVNVPIKLYKYFEKYGFLKFFTILNVQGNKQLEE